MDERKRLLIFFVLSMVIFYGWFTIGPVIAPQWFPKPPNEQAADAELDPKDAADTKNNGEDVKDGDAKPAVGELTSKDDSEGKPENASPDETANKEEPKGDQPKLPDYPTKSIVLGSPDPESGFCQTVKLTTIGAAIVSNSMTDDRYMDSILDADEDGNRPPLKIVGNHLLTDELSALNIDHPPLTFQSWIDGVDKQFSDINEDAGLRTLNWELVETIPYPENKKIAAGAVFRIRSPDGKLEIKKRYFLNKLVGDVTESRDQLPDGYLLDVSLEFKNLGDKRQSFEYSLQGPTGLPLENKSNTRKFRDFKVGFWEPGSQVEGTIYTVSEIVEETDDDELQIFEPGAARRIQYAGIDVQYFAALVMPQDKDEELKEGFLDVAKPHVTSVESEKAESDISVALESTPVVVSAGKSVTHKYQLFLGPKRDEILSAINSSSVMDFSTWFGIGYVSRGMLSILRTFNGVGVPWGIAIIMLTVLVRGCMFPISRKQAAGAKKMKELQPKIAELKIKYANDKEKLGRAQMELFAEANYNPLSGCLPMFLQLPIFIGLYQALNNAVDLRMVSFLWIDNLAAPDALANFPFMDPNGPGIPFLGPVFNLLPIITVILFVVQQKMFMPPPTDEQSAMQYKMMNYMMIFMGFLFYRMPAGLCVYFIASSLWGMSERKLLDIYGKKPDGEDGASAKNTAPSSGPGGKPNKPSSPEKPKKASFWSKLSAKLEEAAEMQQQAQREAQRSKKSKR